MSTSRSVSSDSSFETTTYDLGDVVAEVANRFAPMDVERELRRLIDPEAAVRTVHWGRNYLYEANLRLQSKEVPVVVKAFRNESSTQKIRRRLRGSKADRAWRVSLAMRAAGIPVPEPIARVDSKAIEGPAYFICERVEAQEARYLFRAMNAGTESELFPEIDVDAFLVSLGNLLRRLHEARFWHRDMTPGNVLLGPMQPGRQPLLYLVDLNRTRMGRRLTVSERTRDLCRLPIFRRDHRRTFVRSYQDGSPRMALYLLYHHAFLTRNRVKKSVRGFTGRLKRLVPRSRHVHIEAAERGSGAREQIVWDPLTDQPHQHAGGLTKLGVRFRDAGAHLEPSLAIVCAMPRIWSTYRRLLHEIPAARPAWPEPGVCLSPTQEDPAHELRAVADLGTRRVLLRVSPWENLDAGESLARGLHEGGCELTFAVPQNRDLVRDPGKWKAAVEEIAERFLPFGCDVQLGHAINRSKWGIWNPREYERLMSVGKEVLSRFPGTRVLGPAVIDFEFHQTTAVLNSRSDAQRFDVVTSLLYVDRRGAPENRQGSFDTVKKVALLKAIVKASRNGDRPCWITEVNWPLAEGPHSPAGRGVAVDEEAQADYLVRYYLLTIATGLIDRVYWWQLVARGYGLIDPAEGALRRRPSYLAFAHLARRLRGATLCGWMSVPGEELYALRYVGRDGRQAVVGWANRKTRATITLPRPAAAAFDRDGNEISLSGGLDVEVTSSPRYFELE
jgi:tRNA A-37 threonylcarbamoyl transferase component Bud32